MTEQSLKRARELALEMLAKLYGYASVELMLQDNPDCEPDLKIVLAALDAWAQEARMEQRTNG
jgi:hypothetical protein